MVPETLQSSHSNQSFFKPIPNTIDSDIEEVHSNLKTFEVAGNCYGQETSIPAGEDEKRLTPEGQAQDEDCVDDLGKFHEFP